MPDSPVSPERSAPEPDEREFPELTVGRGRIAEFALRRLKASRPLQVSMALAFVCYGALAFLAVSGQVPLTSAAVVTLLSLASWFFLFWWFPVLERTMAAMQDRPERRWIPRALELVAIACIVVVHGLMLVIVLLQAGE